MSALDMAWVGWRPLHDLVHHSDRRSQDASGDHRAVAAEGSVCTMTRRGGWRSIPEEREVSGRRMIGRTIVSTVLLLLTMAPVAAAQWSLDFYAGANLTHPTDVRGMVWSSAPRDHEFGHFLHGTIDDAEFGPGPVAGVRGWYHMLSWLDLGLDAGWFRTAPHMHFTSLNTQQDGVVPIRVNDTDLTIDAFTLSPQARIVFPRVWRVVPHVSLGPLLAMTRASTDEPDHVTRDATSLGLGLQANIGAQLDLSGKWSLFIEYRFTHLSPSYDFGGPAGRDVSLDLDTSAAIFGVTRRWK